MERHWPSPFLGRGGSQGPWSGAGEGNRTLVTWLGTKSSTIELHPRPSKRRNAQGPILPPHPSVGQCESCSSTPVLVPPPRSYPRVQIRSWHCATSERRSSSAQSKNAGNFGIDLKSSGSCSMTTRAWVLCAIRSTRSNEASVSARSVLKRGTSRDARSARKW
jgi:hypothetical protein